MLCSNVEDWVREAILKVLEGLKVVKFLNVRKHEFGEERQIKNSSLVHNARVCYQYEAVLLVRIHDPKIPKRQEESTCFCEIEWVLLIEIHENDLGKLPHIKG